MEVKGGCALKEKHLIGGFKTKKRRTYAFLDFVVLIRI